jgi:hypothetical protein
MTTRTYSLKCPPGLAAFGGPNGHPNYRRNQDAARHNGHYLDTSDCCVICGRKAIPSKFSVMLSNVGEYITEAEHNDSDDLGLYPVGSDCAKLLKKAGIPVYPTQATVDSTLARSVPNS